MALYEACVPQMKKMLLNLLSWIDKAVSYAEEKKFDPEVLLSARLAPDQYNFTRQVQTACDSAKFAAARGSGQEPPSHPDTESTIEELRARIRSVVEYIESVEESAYAGADERVIVLPFIQGMACRGEDYLIELALPNFTFHLTTAYAILRHNGVNLGKRDYVGSMNLFPAPEAAT
jgi:hypothetical protein